MLIKDEKKITGVYLIFNLFNINESRARSSRTSCVLSEAPIISEVIQQVGFTQFQESETQIHIREGKMSIFTFKNMS